MLLGVVTQPQKISLIPSEVDGLELRLDCFKEFHTETVRSIIQRTHLPILITLRKDSHGGYFSGTEAKREELLKQLFSLLPAYIDLEYDTIPDCVKRMALEYPQVKILFSYHNFESTPTDLEALFARMQSSHVYAYKIATMAYSSLDALRLMEFVKTQTQRGIKMTGLCMGDKGQLTRILGPLYGNLFDYAPLDSEEATAPGQLAIHELCDIYNYKSLNPSTAIYAIIGHPVAKSLSPYIHNAVIKALHRDAVYVRIPLIPEELKEFYDYAKRLGFKGVSVTMPLKEATLPFLDEISPEAKKIGAVNTVAIDWGVLRGSNFDGIGALDAIEKRKQVGSKKVVIIGAGGSARAIAYAAIQRGAIVVVLNRDSRRAEELVAHLGSGEGYGLERMAEVYQEGYDVLINCTPEPLPIDPTYLLPTALIMDIAPSPQIPSLISYAREKGAPIVPGYEMLINQAVGQDFTWFGEQIRRIPLESIILSEVITRIRLMD